MKTRLLLTFCIIAAALVLTACLQTPAPLPAAPTRIPTLIPATMPAPDQAAGTGTSGVRFPAASPAAVAGGAVYVANCASCHGPDGKGIVENARDFTDVDYVRAAAPVGFFQAITGGRGDMPGFQDKLSDEERWNVTYYLWSFSVPAAEIDRGKTVFAEAGCVACHGATGQGAIPQAAKFGPDFVAQWPAARFYQSVSAGKGIMPAHQDRVPAEDRWAAVEYVRSFGYQPASK